MNLLKQYLSFLFFALLLCGACTNDTPQEATQTTKAATTPEQATATVSDDTELIHEFFTAKEVEHILEIKAIFDDVICFEGKIKNIGDCYVSHAQAFGYDIVKQVEQLNQNYPYNDNFDLTQASSHADSLSFLTLNCGFQDEKTGEVVNFYCPKSEGSFMEYLEALGTKNAIIQAYHQEYSIRKQISSDLKKRIGALAKQELDLTKFDHQVFYMFHHLFINEEVKARKKLL